MIWKLGIVVTSFAFLPSVAIAEEHEPLWCMFANRYQCGPGAPCKEFADEDTFIVLDQPRSEYHRCDKKGCTDKPMVISGDYKGYRTFEMPGSGGFAKLGPDGNVSEVVSLASMMIVSYGQCLPESQLQKK